MPSVDMFQAASKVREAIDGLNEVEAKKAILMALVSKDFGGLLVDPAAMALATTILKPEVGK